MKRVYQLRLLWLCKARYMNHDVIVDRYARLFELPECMAAELDLTAASLSYRWGDPTAVDPDLASRWHRFNLPRTLMIGWIFQLLALARSFRPTVVVASSDCLQVILGSFLAKFLSARFVADLYDDYSAFGFARIPGVKWLYLRSLASADGISVVSRTLGDDTRKKFPDKPVIVLESTIGLERFQPRGKAESRQKLGLSFAQDGKRLVGICGGLNKLHGAGVVFKAMELIAEQDPDLAFVVAGKLYDDCPLPNLDNVHYLGMLPHEKMSWFFSAMDVVVVALSNSKFGYYAFPQKAYEVLACRVPVVAANVGALALLFEGLPSVLYDPDSPANLADALQLQLDEQSVLDIDIPTWGEQARRLKAFVEELG